MTKRNIRIAYGTNMGLVGPTGFSLASALSATPGVGHVDILSVSLTGEAVNFLQRIADDAEVSIQFHPLTDAHFRSAKPQGNHVPKAALSRLLLPDYVEGRVIYLDGDTWVRRDLAPLFDMELDGALIGGVRDYGRLRGASLLHAGRESDKGHDVAKIVSPYPADSYINSGVLLLDCAAIRREAGIYEAMHQFQRAIKYTTVDQDYLNELFRGRIKHLNPAWNASWGRDARQRKWISAHGYSGEEVQHQKTSVYHFHGAEKPWQPLSKDKWRRRRYAILVYKLRLEIFKKRHPSKFFA
ncbi:glycosyltransferase family 8 protein [Falsirhodobacter sp. 1013]|uniref:glycosyltransferase family 8 protein n=1 Tax=Falsirhodobacter sp. 1013 TaxID=3417566 RepID=UPI003EBC5B6D